MPSFKHHRKENLLKHHGERKQNDGIENFLPTMFSTQSKKIFTVLAALKLSSANENAGLRSNLLVNYLYVKESLI